MNFAERIISAYVFLTASPQRLEQVDSRRFAHPAGAVMLLGIAWGLVLVGLWGATFYLTWPYLLNWVVPSVVCGLAMVFGPCRRAAAALIETAAGPRRRLCWGGLVLLAAGVAVILNHAFRVSDPDWPTQLPPKWAWLWPRAMCRVLLLAPVWGAWSMLVLGQFHRPNRCTDPPARCFTETVGPLAAAICLVAPLAGSLIFLNFLYPWHFVPPAAAVAAALGAGTLIVRLRGGLSRQALLAGNFLTQLVFLAAYLTVR